MSVWLSWLLFKFRKQQQQQKLKKLWVLSFFIFLDKEENSQIIKLKLL